jgi:ABC-2 type transport system ATP-binding protein
MVVQEYMEFFAAAYNIHGSQRTKVVNDVLELTDLAYKRDAPVDGLSRGMKQRLSIARVLVHDPKVLLLDEPAGNLDPRARIEMRELLKELRRMGKTILISSHILPELQDLCNTVGIIERGELIYSGPWTDIVKRARTGMVLHVGVAHNQELAAAMLSQDPNVVNVANNNGHLEVALKDGVNDYSFIPQRLVQGGFKLTLLKEEEVNLETAFMRLTKGMVQ